jgi:hypothetical protein
VLFAVLDRKLNSYPRWELWLKKPMRQSSGLRFLPETGVVSAVEAEDLQKEANELLAIFSASLRTAKRDFQ